MARFTREELFKKGWSEEVITQYEENGRVVKETRAFIKDMKEKFGLEGE